jgi:hypothetical protein
VGHAEHVLPLYFERPGSHRVRLHPGGPRRSDERADAGAYDQVGHEPTLVQRAEHPDMREALQASPAQHQGELRDLLHRTAPAMLHDRALQWGCHAWT